MGQGLRLPCPLYAYIIPEHWKGSIVKRANETGCTIWRSAMGVVLPRRSSNPLEPGWPSSRLYYGRAHLGTDPRSAVGTRRAPASDLEGKDKEERLATSLQHACNFLATIDPLRCWCGQACEAGWAMHERWNEPAQPEAARAAGAGQRLTPSLPPAC